MAEHNDLGKKGEEFAKAHLLKNGYEVLAQNWRYKKDEVDLIVSKEEVLIIVEVKTRSGDFQDNNEIISHQKQKNLVRAAEAYILENDIDWECQFDVILLKENKGKLSLEHIKDAFYPLI